MQITLNVTFEQSNIIYTVQTNLYPEYIGQALLRKTNWLKKL